MHGARAGGDMMGQPIFYALAAALAWITPVVAGAAPAPTQPADAVPRRFVSDHRLQVGGHEIRYRAVVEEHFLADPGGQRTASVFTTSYERTDLPRGTVRPVMFVFNGGPGSASLWLQMGLVGPKRIAFGDPVKPETVPPFAVVDNDDTPLDVADIVLIDPPGTGFSKILPAGKPKDYYGADADAAATVKVIEDWVRGHGRWNAPKYLLSESYGTVRAALVARLLAGGPMETGRMDGVTLNGVILLGQALDMRDKGDLAYQTALPTMAATACYFGRVQAECTPAGQAEAARALAAGDYGRALYAGSALPDAERSAVAARLSTLIGLPRGAIEGADLRISPGAFSHMLLADRGEQLGLYDGRFTLPLKASGGDPVADDPAMGQYVPGFVASFNGYERGELGVTIDSDYQAIGFRDVNAHWDYGSGPGVPAAHDFADDLAIAMRRNPQLRLMVGCGYYDLMTTLGSAEYTIAHAGIPLAATRFHYYPAGHMSYLGDAPRRALAADLRAFVTAAPAAR